MSERNAPEQGTAGTASPQQRAMRRRLLKAAAASPVIATLHPGAAAAQASAYQCIDNQGELSNAKFEDRGDSLNGDTAVRKKVTYYCRGGVCNAGGGNGGAAGGGSNGGQYPNELFADDDYAGHPPRLWTRGGSEYAVVSGDESGDGEITQQELIDLYERSASYVLQVFQPNADHTDIYHVGTYPKVQLDHDTGNGLHPLTQSCMTSIDPNASLFRT